MVKRFDSGDRGQGHPTGPDSSQNRPFPLTSRMSVLASVKIPILRRLDLGDSAQTKKTPLLTLKLSSQSFLNCTLKDDLSPHPLYTTCTSVSTTTVMKTDAREQSSKLSELKWPKFIPSKEKGNSNLDRILVQFKGSRWKGGDSFLKPSTSRSGSQKFNIPHYPHTMKWERRGKSFWCTTPPVKGPIAILEQGLNHRPGHLTVYETLHDKYETSPMDVHHGVSLFLLDYLLVTAILLVTDVQEWMVVQSPSAENPGNDSTSNTAQWRKIMFGKAPYPKNFNSSHASTSGETSRSANTNNSVSQYAMRQASSPQLSFLSDSSEDEDDEETYRSISGVTQKTQSPSPSSESVQLPLTNRSVPSHTYIDSPYYQHQAPVPPGPSRYTIQVRSTSPVSTRSRRGLPAPPTAPVELPVPSGSRPTPARSQSQPEHDTHYRTGNSNAVAPAHASLWGGPPDQTFHRTRSMSRPLPRTPGVAGTAPHDPVIRRVRSQVRIDQDKPWLFTPPPPLPPLPLTHATPRTSTRSLPPTPRDVAMGRSGGGNPLASEGVQQIRKSFESDEASSGWVQVLEQGLHHMVPSKPSFDQPPPAYTSIDHTQVAETSHTWLT